MWNDRLARWFGCSRASWLTLPRSFMVQMPDEWQEQMAELLEQYDNVYRSSGEFFDTEINVTFRENGKFKKIPDYILNYRHPNPEDFKQFKE